MKERIVLGMLYAFLLVQAIGMVTVCSADATDAYIKKCVQEEIDRQVSHRVQKANQRLSTLKTDIKDMVSSEVKRQSRVGDNGAVERVRRPSACDERGDYYLLPYWPYYSQFYREQDFFQFTFMYDTASESYSSSGHSQDISSMHCNQKCIRLKDILLASKLASQGKLRTAAGLTTSQLVQDNHYLSFMADERIKFDASQDFYRGNFNWARHYWDGDISFGVHIPIAIRHTKIKITSKLSDEIQEKIDNVARGNTADGGTPIQIPNPASPATTINGSAIVRDTSSLQFGTLYQSFPDFIWSILEKKKIAPKEDSTSIELGDIGLYANVNLHSKYYEEGVIGLNLLLPSAQRTDGFSLFDPPVGNNGVTQLSAFMSFLWCKKKFFNPYFHLTGTYSFPARMRKRVPMVRTKNSREIAQGKPARDLICGENLIYTKEFTELDSTVCGFADMTSKVKVSPGPEMLLRLGNSIKNFGPCNAHLDVYYDLFLKSRDSHSKSILDADCDRDYRCQFNLNDKTWKIMHRLGGDLSYQCDKDTRMRLGFFYNVAGRNVPKALGVVVSLNMEFA